MTELEQMMMSLSDSDLSKLQSEFMKHQPRRKEWGSRPVDTRMFQQYDPSAPIAKRQIAEQAPEFAKGASMGLTTDVLGAPVDIATTVLRPFGYNQPSEDIVGGSDWLAKQIGNTSTGSGAETAGRMATGFIDPATATKGASLAMAKGLPLMADLVKYTKFDKTGPMREALENPTQQELYSFFKDVQRGADKVRDSKDIWGSVLRYMKTDKGNTYVASSHEATHGDMKAKMLKPDETVIDEGMVYDLKDLQGLYTDISTNTGNKAKLEAQYPELAEASKPRKESGYLKGYDYPVLVNPTRSELQGMINKSKYGEVRSVLDPTNGNRYYAAAELSDHRGMAEMLGISWESILDAGAGARRKGKNIDYLLGE